MEEGRQLNIVDKIVDAKDSYNNIWYIDGQTVYLKLASEEKARLIGKKKGDTFFCKRIREKHLFKINASYGFTINIIEQLNVDYIELYEDSGVFRFHVDVLRQHGEYLHFKQQGFEKQLFLPLAIIEMYKYTPEEDARRIELLGQEWFNILRDEFDKDYMIQLGRYIKARRDSGINVYPKREDMFRAFKLVPPSKIRVVIMAQDPYHTKDVADGLALSSNKPTYIPPSLIKVFEAIEFDTNTLDLDRNPKLDRWAEQGVFLFNTILTVEEGLPKSHANRGWENFTSKVLLELKNLNHPIVVLLWGNDAKAFRPFVENTKHLILEAEHPAKAARDIRMWNNGNCFSKCNDFLEKVGYGKIEW